MPYWVLSCGLKLAWPGWDHIELPSQPKPTAIGLASGCGGGGGYFGPRQRVVYRDLLRKASEVTNKGPKIQPLYNS